MSDLAPLTVALSVRPFRSVVFVPVLEEVTWQAMFRFALRCQTATWGGWGNLVLPMPGGDGSEDELLWALLDVFDADTFHSLPVSTGDLEELAPDFYRRRHEAVQQELKKISFGEEERVSEQLRAEQLAPLMLAEDLQELLIRRVAPLSGENRLSPFIREAGDPPEWPLVAAEKLKPLPATVEVFTGWPDDDLALLGAAVHGELSPRLRAQLTAAGMKVNETAVTGGSSAWDSAIELRQGVPSQALSSLGLAQYWRPGAQLPGMVLSIGDDAWDFSLACARDRMIGDARWLPTRAADDPQALMSVARIAARIRTRTTNPLRVCSVSAPQEASRFVQELDVFASGLPVEICDPLELVPSSPGRFYERERVGFYHAMVVHAGVTPALPTPVPQNVEPQSANEIRWMTDADVEGWAAVRHPSLSAHVLSRPITEEMTRCGHDGVTYFCPGPMTWAGRSLETQTVRPKLRPLTFLEQVESLLTAAGCGARRPPTRESTSSSPPRSSAASTNSLTRCQTSGPRC